MDAPEEEQDVKLQRDSAALLADFGSSLTRFLWNDLGSTGSRVKAWVPLRETERLVELLSPHQENPQLLDPHLEKFITPLSNAFLEYNESVKSSTHTAGDTSNWISLPEAVCKLLYTLCKIRGEKVILRFLSSEPKNLELLLSSLEASDDMISGNSNELTRATSWEERYITLLWLSLLLQNPFDLASFSSTEIIPHDVSAIPNLICSANLPAVAGRIVPLAIKYLAYAGKERDAAKVLLVRISSRPDMQNLGLLDALIRWSLSCLSSSAPTDSHSSYYYVGILSYISGILTVSTSTSDMDLRVLEIFNIVKRVAESDNVVFKDIYKSALARKIIIKILRSIVVISLRFAHKIDEHEEILPDTIDHLLRALADNDTPVRLAASKALSIITLKLNPSMAAQVIEAILSALQENVVTSRDKSLQDVSRVNTLEWHGLVLTLSHLLYRRSPPTAFLPSIIRALLLGLAFEQRSASGSSIGSNVRDAACFGIWALARRYSTDELLQVDATAVIGKASSNLTQASTLQILANYLVVSASLDPAGNIRRGASAALQELIGRHPDTIIDGITVVQEVDYHAVALRSRAMLEVARKAALIHPYYQTELLSALLEWRGAGDMDPIYRRIAADTIRLLLASRSENAEEQLLKFVQPLEFITAIDIRLQSLKLKDMGHRHGLLLSMAAAVGAEGRNAPYPILLKALQGIPKATGSRKPEMYAEGASRLVSAMCCHGSPSTVERTKLFPSSKELFDDWLTKDNNEIRDVMTVQAVTDAAVHLLHVCLPHLRQDMIEEWLSKSVKANGYLSALVKSFGLLCAADIDRLCQKILDVWKSARSPDTKIVILKTVMLEPPPLEGLSTPNILTAEFSRFVDLICDGLDDYTTDGRGDIGSLIRVEALRATSIAFASIPKPQVPSTSSKEWYDGTQLTTLLSRVLRLAGEKLDKIRAEAKLVMAQICRDQDRAAFEALSISYGQYHPEEWRLSIFEGIVTSADSGSEDIIRSSRYAIALFATDNVDYTAKALFDLATTSLTNERILTSVLEAISFLFDMHIIQQVSPAAGFTWGNLCLLVQKSHYKSNNVRKIDVCIRLYGGLLAVYPEEAMARLLKLLLHPYPQVRNRVAEVLWVWRGVGKGVDWTKAGRGEVRVLEEELRRRDGEGMREGGGQEL